MFQIKLVFNHRTNRNEPQRTFYALIHHMNQSGSYDEFEGPTLKQNILSEKRLYTS